MKDMSYRQLTIIADAKLKDSLSESLPNSICKFPELKFNFIFIKTLNFNEDALSSSDFYTRFSTREIILSRDFGTDANLKSGIDTIDTNFTDAAILILCNNVNSEKLTNIINAYLKGFDIVFLAPKNVCYAEILLIGGNALKIMQSISEPDINIQELAEWIGFEQTTITYNKQLTSSEKLKYKFKNLLSSSSLFFQLSTSIYFAIALLLFSAISFIGGYFTSLATLTIIMAAIILSAIALIGTYINRIHLQTLNRPLYIIREKMNL